MKRTIIITALITGLVATSAWAAGRGNHRGMDFSAMDADGSGTISAAEVTAFAAARFAEADANGDGMIVADEMSTLIEARAGGDIDEDRRARMLERMTERLDADEDGQISLAEFSNNDRQARMFDRLDADDDGELSQAELEKVKKKGKRKGKRGGGDGDGDRASNSN